MKTKLVAPLFAGLVLASVAAFAADAHRATLADFQKANALYTSEDLEKMPPGTIGASPAKALVAVLFSDDGALITADEYNAAMSNRTPTGKPYFTTLAQYSLVTGEVADESKLKAMPKGDGTTMYLYDVLARGRK